MTPLEPWIIEEIRKREERERWRREEDRPQPEIPLDEPRRGPSPSAEPEKPQRGVIIIPYGDEDNEGASGRTVIQF